jgi:hypothetical protein
VNIRGGKYGTTLAVSYFSLFHAFNLSVLS